MLIIEEVSPTVCRQTLEGDVNIRIPGLGSIAERIIRQSLKDVYSNIPQVVERCDSSLALCNLLTLQAAGGTPPHSAIDSLPGQSFI